MNELVYNQNNKAITTSLKVAEVFGKRHDNVMRDIRELLGGMLKIEETPMFEEVTYINEQNGQQYPMYLMNRDGFTLLAMGFTGKKALEFKISYIDAFNKMETELRRQQETYALPQSFSEALRLAARQQEKIENQQKELTFVKAENETLKARQSYVDVVLQCKATVTTTAIAQDYGMSAKAFNKLLHELGIQYKVGAQWILYGKYLPLGYVQSETIQIVRSNGRPDVVMNTRWTQKGRLFLYERLKKSSYLPTIEKSYA